MSTSYWQCTLTLKGTNGLRYEFDIPSYLDTKAPPTTPYVNYPLLFQTLHTFKLHLPLDYNFQSIYSANVEVRLVTESFYRDTLMKTYSKSNKSKQIRIIPNRPEAEIKDWIESQLSTLTGITKTYTPTKKTAEENYIEKHNHYVDIQNAIVDKYEGKPSYQWHPEDVDKWKRAERNIRQYADKLKWIEIAKASK